MPKFFIYKIVNFVDKKTRHRHKTPEVRTSKKNF